MPKAQTYDEIMFRAQQIHGEKYTYLGFGPLKAQRRTLRIVCPEHGEFVQLATSHLRGAGCSGCAYVNLADSKRPTLESAILAAQKVHGTKYNYLSLAEDVRGKSTITYNCSQHGQVTQSLRDHLNGHQCKPCGYSTLVKSIKDKFKYYKAKAEEAHNFRYTYLGSETVDGVGYFSVVCSEHGTFKQRFTNHANGEGCPKCKASTGGRLLRYDISEYIQEANKIHDGKYTYGNLIYSGPGTRSKIEVFCVNHGKFLSNAKDHLAKSSGCPTCSPKTSKDQLKIYEFLKSCGAGVELELGLDSSQKRWDIVDQTKKLAIEYDGLVWHSSRFKAANGQIEKFRQATAAGFRQINIFEDEWLDKPLVVKRLLLNALGLSQEQKIPARTCKFVNCDAAESRDFLTSYHLQGFRSSSRYVGLKALTGELVAVLGYELRASGRGRHQDMSQMEITRYATSCSVAGGFSRCLTNLLRTLPSVTGCYTFSDNRLYTGKTYASAGFTAVANIPHDYSYTKSGRRFHKGRFKKSLAHKWADIYDKDLSEKDLAQLNGYYQIYDCGKTKWELKM